MTRIHKAEIVLSTNLGLIKWVNIEWQYLTDFGHSI